MMHSKLKDILTRKREEVRQLKRRGLPGQEEHRPRPARDFKGAISRPNGINLIAEIKYASPSEGTIREKSDPVPIAKRYEEAGAAAISLLTDKTFFRGDLTHLPRLKEATALPILRKDFVVDEIQIHESHHWGADAVLLIARILSGRQLDELSAAARELGMAALIEVHDRADLEKALENEAQIIGINNRNLDTFDVDLHTTLDLAPLAPDHRVVVSESGIHGKQDILLLKQAGIHAVLVGTSLMKGRDLQGKTEAIVAAGRDGDGQN